MAEEHLPQQINVLRLAEQGAEMFGHLPVNKMPRLSELLLENNGDIAVNLTLGKDDEGRGYLKGHIKGGLVVECQRCLKPVTVEIDDDIALSPVFDETDAERLPEHYEPLMIDRERQFVSPLIEDELILRLPIVATHDTSECHVGEIVTETEEIKTGNNPFDILSELKK